MPVRVAAVGPAVAAAAAGAAEVVGAAAAGALVAAAGGVGCELRPHAASSGRAARVPIRTSKERRLMFEIESDMVSFASPRALQGVS
jgi:hypothetical protein